MIEFIYFGLIDNGILIFLGLLGVSLNTPIEKGLNWLLRKTRFRIESRSAARFGLFSGGLANAVSDFFGGLGISYFAAIGTFIGCIIVAVIAIPLVFKIEKRI